MPFKKGKKEEKEDDPELIAKKKQTLKDGILTLVANEFHRIFFGCVMVVLNLTTYLMSYLRHYQEEKTITLQYTYFLGPIMSITMGLFTPTVGIIENKIGLKLSIVLGSVLSIWSSVILYLSKNYFVDLFAFFIMSLGSAMSALMSRNLMGYFFHVRGKLSGIISVIGSLVSAAYNEIGEKWIVNPNSEEAVVDKSYYTFDVSKNLLTFYKFSWVCITIGTILTLIFIVPFDSKKHVKLFPPKGLKKFDKNKFKKFGKKPSKKEDILKDDKMGPLIPEEEKKDDQHEEIDTNKEKEENDKEIKEEEKDNVPELEKKNIKKEKKDKLVTKITVPVSNSSSSRSKSFFTSSDNDIHKEIENENRIDKKRSHSVIHTAVLPSKAFFLNIIPEMENIAVPPLVRPQRKKFNLKLIKQALKSRRVLFLFLMGVFSSPLNNFLMSTWRPIGIRKGIPTYYLQKVGTYRPFITCGATVIFSILSDYIPFRYLYASFSILSTIIGITFCFTFRSPIFFIFIILLNSVVFSGNMSITSPHYMKVFGLKYYIEIGGVIGLSRVFMSPLCTVFIFLFETYIAAPEEGQSPTEVSDKPYFILFITCGLLNVIATILSLFETEEPYTPE
jgi:MFS family permease